MRHALSQSHLLLDFNFILGFFFCCKFEEILRIGFLFSILFLFLKGLNYEFVDKFFVVVCAI